MMRDSLVVAGVAAVLVLATAGAVAVGLGTADAQSTVQDAERTISVSATGTADAAPDRAVVRVAVTADGNSSAAVRDELAAEAADLRNALDGLGVEYETAEYAIERRHRERVRKRGAPGSELPEYRGVHAFEVTVGNPDDVGAVIDAAADAGAEVEAVRLTLSEQRRADLREEAIRAAMADARAQATTIASAGDLRVTGVATVDASRSRYVPVSYDAAAAGGNAETVVSTGEVSVRYRVEVTYNATAT